MLQELACCTRLMDALHDVTVPKCNLVAPPPLFAFHINPCISETEIHKSKQHKGLSSF
jgi:hypothetical protein